MEKPAERRTEKRAFGLIAIVAGVVWVLVVHALAVNQSHVLVASYTYLVTGSPLVPGSVTLFTVAKALVEHPHRWIQMMWGRRKIIYEVLIPTGVVGVASPWAVGSDLMVFFLQAIASPAHVSRERLRRARGPHGRARVPRR